MTSEVEEARSILSRAALSLPPPHAIRDLLSSGVCVRCIFRFFGVRDAYSCSILSSSLLHLFLEEEKEGHSGSAENGLPLNGLACESDASQISESDHSYCSICLGILQLACHCDQEIRMCEARDSVEAFTAMISEVTKGENHQIDGFSLEVSIPPIIVANERALRLYLKRKYNCEEWFKDKFPSECISVKDALRLSITKSLEKHLDAKSGVNSVRIQLMYTHFDSIAKLQLSFGKEHVSKRRKSEDGGNVTNYAYGSSGKDSNKDMHSEFDAAILRSLNSLEDDVFIEHFASPPDKVSKPCQLTVTCCRMPVYIRGRYLKFSRKVSQSCWMIDDERMGEASIEEIVGNNTLSICRGDGYKFHAAGREDIDVRMLGSGRPFLVEVINARCMPSMADIQQIADTINNFEKKYVRVKNLEVVGSEAWTLMREGEAEKQKQYAALVWISRPLTEQDLQSLSSIKNMEILQRTPIRVLHRRSPLERQRMIHWMMVEEIAGNCQYFLLHLCTQAGTYIKEFVHGDLGRTHPSVTQAWDTGVKCPSILKCPAQLSWKIGICGHG